jgi:integrase
MGRTRKTGKHLPRGMLFKHGAYYLKLRNKWHPLSKDYGEALRLYADLVGRLEPVARTVADGLSLYIAVNAKRLAKDTLAGYEQSQKRLVAKFGHMPLGDLKREHVYRYLFDSGRVCANRDRALLSAMYTHLLNCGVFKGKHPCYGLHYRAPERARRRYVTDDELGTLIAALPRKLALMARWAYLTGMRQSDMLALKIGAGSDAGVTYKPSKSRNAEPTTITWTAELREVWDEAAGVRKFGLEPLFANRNGKHYSRDSFQSTWQRWRNKCGIENLRWHDLRRKTGSDSDSDASASERLGHADQAVTRKHYRAKPRTVSPIR